MKKDFKTSTTTTVKTTSVKISMDITIADVPQLCDPRELVNLLNQGFADMGVDFTIHIQE